MRLGLDRCNLNQTGIEKHIEYKSDNSCGEDDLLSFDKNSCGTMWNFINCDQKNPINPKKYHHHDKLRSKSIRKTIIPYNA